MNKEEQIKQYLSEPIKVGDNVYIKGLGIKNKQQWGSVTEVTGVLEDGGILYGDIYSSNTPKAEKGDWKKYTGEIGVNPIVSKPWNSSVRTLSFGLDSVLFSVGYNRRKSKFTSEMYGDVEVEELNWNPFIIDSKGNKIRYQRGFVWTLEQKQLLIDSIYRNIDIGKIIIRKRSFKWVENQAKNGGEPYHKDIVDGKQRLNTILGFLNNEFPDLQGNYWRDFSDLAQGKFCNFSALSYGELEENATDEDVKSVFLGVNYMGTPMSEEHINFVKSIEL